MAAAHNGPCSGGRPVRSYLWPGDHHVGRVPGGAAVLGTRCERPGQTGVFVQQGGTWHQAGPPLSSRFGPYEEGRAEVLGLMPDGGGLAALVGLTPSGTKAGGDKGGGDKGGGHKGGRHTHHPRPGLRRRLGQHQRDMAHIARIQPGHGPPLGLVRATPAGGVFVLGQGPSGVMPLDVAEGPGRGWRDLPAPPNSTATVAFLPGGTVDALAVNRTILTVWALSPGTSTWAKAQVLGVPVRLGSSS
jgi:hypothetical protein